MTGTLRDSLMALSEEVRVVDLHARVLRGSRRIKLRNRAIGAVAAFLALSSGAVAVAAMRPSPSPAPDPTISPSPTVSPSPAVILPNVDIRNATFEVPAFPGDDRCPAATRAFTDGKAVVRPGDTTDYVRLVMPVDQIRGDVDGEPGEEILTRLFCSDYSSSGQVLALKVSPGGKLTPLGFVLISPDHQSFEVVHGSLRVQAGTVLVELLGPDRSDGPMSQLDLQTRGYSYRDGAFQQVTGPTKFAQTPDDYRKVDFRNVTAVIRIPGEPPEESQGILRLSDGKGTVVINKVSYDVTVLSSAFFTERKAGAVLYQLKPAGGPTRTFVNVYEMPYPVPGDLVSMMKDPADLTGATKVEVSGAQLRVTIDGQVRTYRQDDTGAWVSSA